MRASFSTAIQKAILVVLLMACPTFGEPGTYQALPLSIPLAFRWGYASEILSTLQPACGGQAVYVPLSDGTLISLSTRDGQLGWKTDTGGSFPTPPAVSRQSVYVLTEAFKLGDGADSESEPTLLRALSGTSGITLWARKFSQRAGEAVSVSGDQLFVTLVNEIYAIDRQGGQVRWSAKLTHTIGGVSETLGSKLYISTLGSYIYVLDQNTGKTLQRYRTRGEIAVPPVFHDDVVYLGTADGYLCALRVSGDNLITLWRKRAGGRVQSLVDAGDGLLVTTPDNFVQFFGAQNGKRRWKRLLPARLAEPILLAANEALFAPLGEDTCIVLSLRDGKQLNAISLGHDNSVTAAPTLCGGRLIIPTRAGLMAFAPAG
ncbi:MAG: PQQ-binding-like beta-propeller repeat protein [Pyrinomonadaceae bacterium]